MPSCDHCQNKTSCAFSQAFNATLCASCRTKEPYKMLYKTTAKNQYFLTDKDLNEIETFAGPRNRNGGACGHRNTFLVRESDIKNLFCQKFNLVPNEITGKLQELQTIKDTRRTNRLDRVTQLKNQRKQQLTEALAKYQLTLRNDSKLCQGYIDGSIKDWTIDQIVHRMCQMHFLFNYANMVDCLEQAHQLQREELEAGYFPDCTAFEQAEMIALDKKPYPIIWPWLTNPINQPLNCN